MGRGHSPENYLHVSHVPFSSESKIPTAQETPGNCVLCPLKKYLKDNWDKRWHYNSVHIVKLIVVEEVCALKCKCSAVRSRGWAKDHSTRNSHYHCTVCHWPRDRYDQIANHVIMQHQTDLNTVHHLPAKT